MPILNLTADFKTTKGCNSGIKIFAQPNLSPIDKVTGKPTSVGSGIGMEFQILDDEHHPDAKLGRNGDRTLGSLYDLIPAPKDKKGHAGGRMEPCAHRFAGQACGVLAERGEDRGV